MNSLPVALSGTREGVNVASLIDQINIDVQDVKNALVASKIAQVHYMNTHNGVEDIFVVGDLLMLLGFNCWQEYKKKGKLWVAKFFPCWDGPYRVTKSVLESSSHILDTQNAPNNILPHVQTKTTCP